jgi:hypothetical protein
MSPGSWYGHQYGAAGQRAKLSAGAWAGRGISARRARQPRLAQLHFNDDGLMVELPKSKTKQKGEAEEKAIFFAPDRRSYPMRAVKGWLELLQQHSRTSGPFFLLQWPALESSAGYFSFERDCAATPRCPVPRALAMRFVFDHCQAQRDG